MAVTMYTASVPVFLQLLGGLKTTLTKGEEQCAAKKLDPAVVLNLRLYPDMFPLNRQVRQVCQHALGAATVAGVTAPTFPETDNSFVEMQSRIDKTIAGWAAPSIETISGSTIGITPEAVWCRLPTPRTTATTRHIS